MTEQIGIVYRNLSARTPPEVAVHLEDLGYDSLWISEGTGRNTVAVLAEVAAATDAIGLGSAILNVFSRTPALLAMTGATLQRISDGRFTLGVGASHPELVEGVHGLPYRRPVRRTRETVELLERFTSGDPDGFAYDGEIFAVDVQDTFDREFPIYNAAMGPANRDLTGELCDGWMPNQIPVSQLQSSFERVAAAARKAGRSPGAIDVYPWITAVVDDDEAAARASMRRAIAGYVGRYDAYRNAVASSHPDSAAAIHDRWSAGDRAGAADAVTDELVDAIGIVGEPDRCRRRLVEICEMPIVDAPIVSIPRWVDGSIAERTIAELAPASLESR